MATLTLKPGKERSLLRHHPWLFSGAVAKGLAGLQPGATVDLLSSRGEFLAHAAASPHSQIVARVWSFAREEAIDREFFRRRLSQALVRRAGLPGLEATTGLRLVNAESDGLPGLIVDRYGDLLVCQFLAAGPEFWKATIVELLGELLPHRTIYERSEAAVRAKEGLAPVKGLLAGPEPPELVEIEEGGLKFLVDVVNGHKTGFYLDQRENRRTVGLFARGRSVLNCFAYSGGFGLHALAGGASRLTNLEISAPSLALLAENLRHNGLLDARVENVQGDVFELLRRYDREGRRFDLIVLDPPKFVESQGQLPRGARGYKDINRLAFALLNPGGLLFTFSCSGLLPADLFQKIVADGALDAGREARIISKLGQALDHPIALNFPEGSYLKGLLCRVD
ncbi:MAG: 23S rRNA (cytosine(1962)-C(5))-methyltransferase RlmI [Desulfobulbaceae bacterium]|nr:23S rRNA (cytosine(1962)-C(5))-methyltransferase RlmI [Desulfobulbaceae bacterium]